ncbi:DNA polymerase-3 subunit gamma/tau [Nitrosomonas eutropha]|uniref:DNA polymerase III subunit gamma/tau n=1 Tax=Nitrosomonas eutropha TaxID=916 RepID=A0A1I7J247_9PROT|nr:DNA polymerase-3 subunit gamma/tau [Nitrosomonas eutropha]
MINPGCNNLFSIKTLTDSQALARKWRPKDFTGLVGQEHVVRALVNSMEQNRLHHAYLFTGTRGVGKTTVARILAKALNCEQGITATPCGKCAACLAIDQGSFVDLIELDAASNTQVDAIRELLDNAQYAPVTARYKVYLIDEVHMLSKSAFNAMLKTLEEPPEHVKFILATTDPQKIPVTVLSRCLQFNLKQIPPSLIEMRLSEILSMERIVADAAALKLLAKAAKGSLRDALSLLDQAIALGNATVDETNTRAMLGVLDQDHLFALLEALAEQDGIAMLAIADQLEAASVSFDSALQDLAALLHRLATVQIVPQMLDEEQPEGDRLLALIKRFTPEDIQLFYQIALHGRTDLGQAPDEYSGFTMTLMRMLAFMPHSQPSSHPVHAGTNANITRKIKSGLPADSRRQEKSIESDSPNDAWLALVNQLELSGMTRMLAQYSEAKHFSASRIELCVTEMHKHLLEKSYQDKLKFQLESHFGEPVEVVFSLGSITGVTPAVLQDRDKLAKQSRAVEAIESDPYVQELVEQFDAKLNISSIKPIN